MPRFCSNCGTEVDATAVFCPTCGQPIDDAEPAEMPAAPAWPDPATTDAPAEEAAVRRDEEPPAREERGTYDAPTDAPTRVESRPPDVEPGERPAAPPPPPGRASPAPAATGRDAGGSSGPRIDLPLTTPVTLSGWLIGLGAVLAVLGLVIILVTSVLNVIDLLLLLALLAVAATVFFSTQLPAVPHLRLMTLIVALIAFGVALDRVGFGGGGAGELLLFMGSAAAAIGAILLELGQDQPLGGPQR